jgi:hypothetical protein
MEELLKREVNFAYSYLNDDQRLKQFDFQKASEISLAECQVATHGTRIEDDDNNNLIL